MCGQSPVKRPAVGLIRVARDAAGPVVASSPFVSGLIVLKLVGGVVGDTQPVCPATACRRSLPFGFDTGHAVSRAS